MKEKLNLSLDKEIKDLIIKLSEENHLKPSQYITTIVLKEVNK